jgi:hypothetical protein
MPCPGIINQQIEKEELYPIIYFSTGRLMPVTGLDGRIPVVIGIAAWKSYRERRPVKLSEI